MVWWFCDVDRHHFHILKYMYSNGNPSKNENLYKEHILREQAYISIYIERERQREEW